MATSDPKDADTIRFCKPFDDDDADLIIRSSDNVHFRVHKLILRKASMVFDGMIIIPTDDDQPVVQTVPLEEDGVTISGFLHLCYPFGGSPEVGSLDAVSTLLGVCDKYQAHGLAEKLGRAELMKFVDEDPLRVYVLACRASILEVTQRAAYGCLTLPLETIVSSTVPELRQLSASVYRSLLVYYTKCRRTAASLLVSGNIPWVKSASEYCWFAEDGHNDCPTSNMVYHYLEEGIWKAATTREWWCNIMAPAEDYLLYQAPPLSPRLGKRIPIPTPRRFQCKYCKERYDRDMRHFFTCLEAEMSKRVKNVEFKFVT